MDSHSPWRSYFLYGMDRQNCLDLGTTAINYEYVLGSALWALLFTCKNISLHDERKRNNQSRSWIIRGNLWIQPELMRSNQGQQHMGELLTLPNLLYFMLDRPLWNRRIGTALWITTSTDEIRWLGVRHLQPWSNIYPLLLTYCYL